MFAVAGPPHRRPRGILVDGLVGPGGLSFDVHLVRKLWLTRPLSRPSCPRKVCIMRNHRVPPVEWGFPQLDFDARNKKSGWNALPGWKGQRSTAWPAAFTKTWPKPRAPLVYDRDRFPEQPAKKNPLCGSGSGLAVVASIGWKTIRRLVRAYPFLSTPYRADPRTSHPTRSLFSALKEAVIAGGFRHVESMLAPPERGQKTRGECYASLATYD